MQEQAAAGKRLLFEGAQAFGLDVDHGTYPFVTPSSTGLGGAISGSGVSVSPKRIIGVLKAYVTRVGKGPFPTKMDKSIEQIVAERGKEIGATTGRIRDCGWLDLREIVKAVRANEVEELALMKLDVLGGLNVKLYDAQGKEQVFNDFPQVTPEMNSFERLPKMVQEYVQLIESNTGCKVTFVSTGAGREETIERNHSDCVHQSG